MRTKLHLLLIGTIALPGILLAQNTAKPVKKPASAPPTEFTISGKIGTLNKPAKVYLDYHVEGKMTTDSADVVNGAFTLHGPMPAKSIASGRMTLNRDGKGRDYEIYATHEFGDVVYIDFGCEKITFTSKDSLHNAVVQGSKVYDERVAFEKATGLPPWTMNRTANMRLGKLTPEQSADTSYYNAIDRWVRAQRKERMEKVMAYPKTHLNSRYSVQALKETWGLYKVPQGEIEAMFNNLTPAVKATYEGQEFARELAARKAAVTGNQAPGFTQANVKGEPVSLSAYKGKWVLLEFWASWCSPCRAESPNLIKQYALYKDKGFEILSVSADSDRKKWVTAIEKDGLTWEQVSDLKGWSNEAVKLYALTGVPANFLIDPQGKIVAQSLIGEDLNKKLEEIFAQK
jgi:peroxiredoxin